MSIDPGLSAAIARGRLDAGPREYPVVVLLGGMPLELFGQLMTAVGDALDDLGWTGYLRDVTGVGVIWARQVEGDLVPLVADEGDPDEAT